MLTVHFDAISCIQYAIHIYLYYFSRSPFHSVRNYRQTRIYLVLNHVLKTRQMDHALNGPILSLDKVT